MDLSLDEIIKANKVSQARSEAGSSVSQQKRGSSLNHVSNRGTIRGKSMNFHSSGPSGVMRGGGAIRGRAFNWYGNSNQGQYVQGGPTFWLRGRGFFNPGYANRRRFVPGYRRGVGFVNRGAFQNFSQRSQWGFVNRGGFGSGHSNYNQSHRSNASQAGSVAFNERLVVPSHMRRFKRGNANNFARFGYQQNRLPVHQRLGWTTPAQHIARQRLYQARQFLNRRPNQFQYNQYRPQYRFNYSMYRQGPFVNQVAYRQQQAAQYRQKRGKANALRNNGRISPTGSDFSIVIQNELAERPVVQYASRGQGRGQKKFVARLSRQNVAQLPGGGYSEAAGPSNLSVSFQSESGSQGGSHFRHNYNSRKNNAFRAQRQLTGASPNAASLPALRRKLQQPAAAAAVDADGFVRPPARVRPHVVILDKEVQCAIRAMQEQLAARTPDRADSAKDLNCRFRFGSQPTTTSINDRFGVLTSLSNCAAVD